MTGIKISSLPPAGVANLTDVYPAVQGGITKKESLQQILNLFQPGVLLSNAGNPNGVVAGTVYQLLWDTLGQALYVATTTGNASTTVWTIVGASAFNFVPAVVTATTGALTVIYNNGAAGVGATLTNNGVQAALSIDGHTMALNDRILVKNQAAPAQNGIYIATNLGSGATNWVMTRATDFDTANEINPGDVVVVELGTANANTSWVQTATVTTVGTDPISFTQLTASPSTFLKVANNLSDVASVPTSLVNLGLGVPTGTGNVVLQTAPTIITPRVAQINGATNNFAVLNFSDVAVAVNDIQISNASAGQAVKIQAIGSDTNIFLSIDSKGTSGVQVKGNSNGAYANAGYLGERISSTVTSGAAVGISGGLTASNVTFIDITAGNWEIQSNVGIASTTISQFQIGASLTSATFPALENRTITNPNAVANEGHPCPTIYQSVSTTIRVYLIAGMSGTGSPTAYGNITAIRI